MHIINKELMVMVKNNGHNCLCSLVEKRCPCSKFIDEDFCRCGVFRSCEQECSA